MLGTQDGDSVNQHFHWGIINKAAAVIAPRLVRGREGFALAGVSWGGTQQTMSGGGAASSCLPAPLSDGGQPEPEPEPSLR